MRSTLIHNVKDVGLIHHLGAIFRILSLPQYRILYELCTVWLLNLHCLCIGKCIDCIYLILIILLLLRLRLLLWVCQSGVLDIEVLDIDLHVTWVILIYCSARIRSKSKSKILFFYFFCWLCTAGKHRNEHDCCYYLNYVLLSFGRVSLLVPTSQFSAPSQRMTHTQLISLCGKST